ncbi:PAS domain-containing protein, partial [Enterobacter asburiae]|uniref:PAS domain-containing protein n=1 Tax=Enterobacter asburiae TaxID=61645 RepID=UPI001952A7AA
MQFLDARLGLEGLKRALSVARLGVFLVDEKATILLANDATQPILGGGLAEVAGRLTARDQQARSALAGAIADVAN